MAFKKNTQRTIVFVMVDSADTKSVKTGLSVAAQVSKDGGSFGNASNSVAEIGSGFYSLALTAAEMNADTVAVKLTATGAVQQNLVLYTDAKLVADLHDFDPAATDVNLSDTDLADLKDSIKGSPSGRTVKEVYDKANAVKGVTDKLDTAVEPDGAVYRFTENALEMAPAGGGGGSDWSSAEKEQIRQALGVSGEASDTTGEGHLDAVLARVEALVGLPALAAADITTAAQDVAYFRGDSKPIRFELGRDIAGASLKCTVKRRASDPQSAALITKSSPAGIEITNAAKGKFAVKLSASDTAGLLPDGRRAVLLYDVEMTLGGAVETIFAGGFMLLPDVTTG